MTHLIKQTLSTWYSHRHSMCIYYCFYVTMWFNSSSYVTFSPFFRCTSKKTAMKKLLFVLMLTVTIAGINAQNTKNLVYDANANVRKVENFTGVEVSSAPKQHPSAANSPCSCSALNVRNVG